VLFHLEGRSTTEVARELGCPVGTVESWLTRARQRLRAGLTRRGLTPTDALFAALVPHEGWFPQAATATRAVLAAGPGAAGAGPAEAAALAGEVVRSLGMARARVAVAVLLLAVAVAAAAGLAAELPPRADPPARPTAPAAVRQDEAESAGQAGAGQTAKLD